MLRLKKLTLKKLVSKKLVLFIEVSITLKS